MSVPSVPDPDLRACAGALVRAGARFVVIGGFAVIANDYVRATEDIDLLIPDDERNDGALDEALTALAATWPPDGLAPLDFATVTEGALTADLGEGEFRVAGLESLVAFKRLADRPRDRLDLLELEERHGPLPTVPIPELEK